MASHRPRSVSRLKSWVSLVLVGMGVTMVAEDAYESLIRRTYQDFETVDLDLLRVVMADD